MIRSKLNSKTQNQQGFSLIELMLAIGVLGVVIAGMASMSVAQQRELKALQQKSETVELKNLLMQTFSNPAVCTAQLAGQTVDISGVTPLVESSTILSLGEIRQGADATSAVIAKEGQVLPLSNYGVAVSKVEFVKIRATGNPDEYVGFFQVSFLRASLVRPLKAVMLQQVVKVKTVSGVTTIDHCASTSEVRSLGTCTERKPTVMTKQACAILAGVDCNPDEVGITGGTRDVINMATQDSHPVYNSDFEMTGWFATFYGTKGNCDIIDAKFPNGTTMPAPQTCLDEFCASVFVYCCKK